MTNLLKVNLADTVRTAFASPGHASHHILLPQGYTLDILTGYCDQPNAVVMLYNGNKPVRTDNGDMIARIFLSVDKLIEAITYTLANFRADNVREFGLDFLKTFHILNT